MAGSAQVVHVLVSIDSASNENQLSLYITCYTNMYTEHGTKSNTIGRLQRLMMCCTKSCTSQKIRTIQLMSNYSWHTDNSKAKQLKHKPLNTFCHLE